MKHVLIAGGTGMIGTRLTSLLQHSGYSVMYLTRHPNPQSEISQYKWDWENEQFDPDALASADFVINLAGANIAGHRWTKSYKASIYNSRVLGTRFLMNRINSIPNRVKRVIQMSAIGIYQPNTEPPGNENLPLSHDFLAQTCIDWEESLFQNLPNQATGVVLRTGLVLSGNGGLIAKMRLPVFLTGGVYFGNGKQFQSWIHVDDLCRIFLRALGNPDMMGIYNAVAPQPVVQKQLMKQISLSLHRRLWLPPVPASVLKWLVGELSGELLHSHHLHPTRLMNEGFTFHYPDLHAALQGM